MGSLNQGLLVRSSNLTQTSNKQLLINPSQWIHVCEDILIWMILSQMTAVQLFQGTCLHIYPLTCLHLTAEVILDTIIQTISNKKINIINNFIHQKNKFLTRDWTVVFALK